MLLKEKPSILNENIKIETCSKKGSCQETKIANMEEKCKFTGNFENDPNSKATVVGCNNEDQDMVLLSDKIKLQSPNYRARKGKVFTSKKTYKMSDPVTVKIPKTRREFTEKGKDKRKGNFI